MRRITPSTKGLLLVHYRSIVKKDGRKEGRESMARKVRKKGYNMWAKGLVRQATIKVDLNIKKKKKTPIGTTLHPSIPSFLY